MRSGRTRGKGFCLTLGLRPSATNVPSANPAEAIQVYQAFLQFKYPGTDIEVTAGLQPTALPQSALFNDSLVFTDWAAAVLVNAPLIPDTLRVTAGFARLIDANRTYDTTTQVGDELDFYILSLPVTTPGFKVTPWGVFSMAGSKAAYFTSYASSFAYLRGNNSPRAIRALNTALGSNPYFEMGRDLTWNESAMGFTYRY